jgi:hypothetical protein
VFGAGSDLQIYHDGSASFVSDQGSGNLRLLAQNFVVADPTNTEAMIVGFPNGSVDLYYDNSKKLATTATGIDVTGTTVTDGMTSDGNVFVSTSSSTTDGTDGAFVDIKNTDTTTSVVSGVRFLNGTTTAFKGAVFFEDLAGDGRGDIVIASNNVASGATTVGLADQRLRVSRSGDISFYDSVGVVQNFYWDASTSRLGLGTTSPNGLLETKSTGDNFTYLRSGDANTVGIIFGNQSDAATASIQMLHSDNSLSIRGYNNTERARIDASGNFLVGSTTFDRTVDGVYSGNDGLFYATSTPGATEFVSSFNRNSTDGGIIRLQKDGATVGSIGTSSSSLYIGKPSGSGLMFQGGNTIPVTGSSAADATYRSLWRSLQRPLLHWQNLCWWCVGDWFEWYLG